MEDAGTLGGDTGALLCSLVGKRRLICSWGIRKILEEAVFGMALEKHVDRWAGASKTTEQLCEGVEMGTCSWRFSLGALLGR